MLAEREKGFLLRFLDPCGEFQVADDCSKVPDGALPNSALIGLREFLVIRSPWGDGDVSSGNPYGSLWNLYIILLPYFRHCVLLLSNDGAAELTQDQLTTICRELNTLAMASQPIYPSWFLSTSGVRASYIRWTALSALPTPTNGQSDLVTQYRICNNGCTVYHNAPDLVNQGMIIGAQWNADIGSIGTSSAETDGDHTAATSVAITISGPVVAPTTILATASFPWSEAVVSEQDAVGTILVLQWSALYAGLLNGHTLDVGTGYQFNVTSVPNAAPAMVTVTITLTTQDDPDTVLTTISTNPSATVGEYSAPLVWQLESDISTNEVRKTVRLPPVNTEGMIQSTPKAVVLTMKEDNGAYMVSRVFQPVFNLQEANTYGPMLWRHGDQDLTSDFGGLRDTHDLNFGFGVMSIVGIPNAAAPTLKLIRDVEVVAPENSPWAVMMHENAEKSEATLEIARTIMDRHPFMYPESYNSMGGLLGILGSVISKIPLVGSILPVVKNVLDQVVQPPTSQGASQNRLSALDGDQLHKVLGDLLAKLRL